MIIPAIDLLEGAVVRLRKGNFGDRITYKEDPVSLAGRYADAGAEWIHVVDLSGARNPLARQVALIRSIAANTSSKIQVGGGIRSLADVEELLDADVDRVVIGSVAIESPDEIVEWSEKLPPDTLMPALDVMPDDNGSYQPVIKGWTQPGTNTLDKLLTQYSDAGLSQILMTDVSRDGMMKGANAALYNRLAMNYSGMTFQASGGVASLEDIRTLRLSESILGVIIGRVLLDGSMTIEEAIACWQNG